MGSSNQKPFICPASKLFAQEAEEIIRLGNGIEVELHGEKILLDPKRADGVSFVSHAHADHAPEKISGSVILSEQTRVLLGKDFHSSHSNAAIDSTCLRFKLLDSGHILGSSQLLIEDGFRLVYTGDLNLYGGATTKPAEVPGCDVLIIESTYGSPFYHFPRRGEVVKEIKDWVNDCFVKDVTPVLLAYSLGKAQELTRYLSQEFKVVVRDSIFSFNKKYESAGVELGKYHNYNETEKIKEDCVILIPPRAKNLKLPEKYSKAIVSGWALHSAAKRWYSCEEAFPLSDHSDFYALLEYVEKASPQVVYTVHGFAEEFAMELRERGFYAEALVLL